MAEVALFQEPKTVPNRRHFDLVLSGEGPSDARWQ